MSLPLTFDVTSRETWADIQAIRAKPINYHVSLFDLQLGSSWEYKGVVKIDAKVTRPTKEIVLNSKEINVQTAEVLRKDGLLLDDHGTCRTETG